MPNKSNPLLSIIDRRLDTTHYRDQHWEGSFWDYLDVAMENPGVARNAFQRVYDMILSYGTEKRILLLHGPVGSSKSTIARLLKKGLENYSKTDPGKTFTYMWRVHHRGPGGDEGETYVECPMHEEPLLLIPREARGEVLDAINERLPEGRRLRLYGDICPFCRKVMG